MTMTMTMMMPLPLPLPLPAGVVVASAAIGNDECAARAALTFRIRSAARNAQMKLENARWQAKRKYEQSRTDSEMKNSQAGKREARTIWETIDTQRGRALRTVWK